MKNSAGYGINGFHSDGAWKHYQNHGKGEGRTKGFTDTVRNPAYDDWLNSTGTGTGTGTAPAPGTDLGALTNINPSGYAAPQSNIQDVYGTANMPEHKFFSYGV